VKFCVALIRLNNLLVNESTNDVACALKEDIPFVLITECEEGTRYASRQGRERDILNLRGGSQSSTSAARVIRRKALAPMGRVLPTP
jgi:hypothetical protein